MATSPVPLWAREMHPDHRGPTGAGVLALALLVVLVVVLGGLLPGGGQAGATEPDARSLCDQHPRWSVCQEPPARP